MAQKKTPVTLLQEVCVKNKVNVPIYQEIPNPVDKMFTIQVEALDEIAEGSAPSKQEAKHIAAALLLQKIEKDWQTLNIASYEKVNRAESDYVSTLMDICIQGNHPLASFTEIDARGPSHAPTFTYRCEVGEIKRTAEHTTKKGAKQLAAKEMVDVIQKMYPDNKKVLVPLSEAKKMEEEQTQRKFKNYREWKNSDLKTLPGVKLADRHNFFANLADTDPEKYANAMLVFQIAEPDEEEAHLLAKALGYKLFVTNEPGYTVLEMDCDFETVHIGQRHHIFRDFLSYMRVMLTKV
uniref:Putative staufen n=2 Tax=Nyssomyia neivai TaxID=330878 RepID=A0A1L8DGT8_9DIPT